MALSVVSDGSALVDVADFRGILLKRAFNLLDNLHSEVDGILSGLVVTGTSSRGRHDAEQEVHVRASISTASSNTPLPSALAVYNDGVSSGYSGTTGPLAAVETRTAATRKALDLLDVFQTELDQLLTQQGLESYANAHQTNEAASMQLLGLHPEPESPHTLDMELVRTAAATTSAAARFRTQAAETAQGALKAYVDALAQVSVAMDGASGPCAKHAFPAWHRACVLKAPHVCHLHNGTNLALVYVTLAMQRNVSAEASSQATELEYTAAVQQASGNLPQALEAMRASVRYGITIFCFSAFCAAIK